MATLTARRSVRLFVAKPAQQPPVESVSPEPVEPIRTAVEHMASRNPAFTLLVESLDLVEVWSTSIDPNAQANPFRATGIIPEPYPELKQISLATAETPKLRALANRAFAPNETYLLTEAIERLATSAGVSVDRARNGITMMEAQDVLGLTLSNEYYLFDSTPF